jgi:predicted Mrr-cat superfamily restriction endonuclease
MTKSINSVDCDSLGRISMKIWKISAGQHSDYWKRFVDEKIAAFGAWDEGSFRNYKTREELFRKVNEYSLKERGKTTTSHVEAWNFYKSIEIGDLMVLYREGRIVAIGFVAGDYDYVDSNVWNGEKYFHVRPTKWKLLDLSKQKVSSHLKKSLSVPPDTLHEIDEKEDIVEILRIVVSDLIA